MAAVTLEQALVCQNCGTAPWQWEQDPSAFTPVLYADHGCMVKDRFADATRNLPRQPGTSVRLLPRDTAARMAAKPSRRPKSPREIARAKREGR